MPIQKPTLTDAELIAAVRARDRKATALFVGNYSDGLYGYLHRRLAPRTELAEDLLHEVFVTAFQSIDKLREPDALRSEDNETPADSVGADFEQLLDDERLERRIRCVMEGIEDDYRTVLRWRYWEQRSTREMAAALERTEKAVERLLARARLQFKRRWNETS